MDQMNNVALELQPCCGNRSGIGMYTYEIAKRLLPQENLIFYGNIFNFCGRNNNSESLKGIEMPLREWKIFPYGVYRRAWKQLPLSYDRIFPGNAALSVFFNFIVPPKIDGKVITVIYDMVYRRFPETMDKKNLARIRRDIEYSIERSSRIITISEFSKREIMELLCVDENKISIVYPSISLTEGEADMDELRRKFAIDGEYILFVGTIEPRKNLARLIKAFELLKERYTVPHKLVLAGGNGWANEEIYETARSVSCAENIVFAGYVSGAEKNTLYKNAAALAFPSLYEGFGMPPLEAMHFGCPVVCSNAASLPEAVGEAAEIVEPYDIESITEGIYKVISQKKYAATMVQRGYEQEKKFSWEASAKKFVEVCCSVLEEP